MSKESLMAWCMEDLLPRMHMTADLRMTKDSLHLNQPMRVLYGTSRFRDSKSAKCLWKACASLPIPPEVESISGVKVPCLISSTCWSYVLFFSSSCFLYAADRLLEGLLGALG